MIYERKIIAKDGEHFYRTIAALSFEGFVECGVGAVVVREGSLQKKPDGSIEVAPIGSTPVRFSPLCH